jgi:cytochrome P450
MISHSSSYSCAGSASRCDTSRRCTLLALSTARGQDTGGAAKEIRVDLAAAGSKGAERPTHVPANLVVDFDVYEQRRGMSPVHLWWLDLREQHDTPFVWTPRNGGHWICLRGDDIMEMLADSDRFSSRSIMVPRTDRSRGPRFLPLTLDPPEHGAYRAILNPILAPQPVRAQEQTVRSIVSSLIERIKGVGSCEFMEEFARKVPSTVILSMANLPLSDAGFLVETNENLVRPRTKEDGKAAKRKFGDYFRPVIDARRGGLGTDPITSIANARVDGRPLSDDDTVGMVKQFVGAGLDTTASMMGFMVFFLARNPVDRKLLIENPKLVPAAIREMLRRFGFIAVARMANHDLTFHGVDFKAEDMIVAPTALVSGDADIFSRPLVEDLSRPHGPQGIFGEGRHRCPGASLARFELTIAIEEWLKNIPDFEIDTDALTFQNGIVPNIVALPLRWRA